MKPNKKQMKTSLYSFDLWNTLIKPNPQFGIERARYIIKELGFPYTPEEIIVNHFKKGSILFNKINETRGVHTDAEIALAYVLHGLDANINKKTIKDLQEKQEELFLEYPPLPYDENTISTLKTIKKKFAICLISNTGFIRGKVLKQAIKKIGFPNFDWMLFSDELGISKPNEKIFILAENKAYEKDSIRLRKDTIIFHIGDNEKADVAGANAIERWKGFQINTNNKTILDVLNLQKEII